MIDFSKLCIHTQTTKPWSIEECIINFASAGVKGISIWRHLLEGKDLNKIKSLLDSNQMDVVSLVRGGFFPSVDSEKRALASIINFDADLYSSTLCALENCK